MSYSIVHSKQKWGRNKFNSFKGNETLPFEIWYNQKNRDNVLFTHNEHHGTGICIHTMFSPDTNGNSGTFVYQYNGDYTTFDVCAKVLIDIEKKTLYIYNCIMDFEYMSFNDRKDDIIFKNGGIKALKKTGNYDDAINKLTTYFFGDIWRCHALYKKKNINKENKKNLKLVKNISYLPNDIHEYITNKMTKWSNIKKVTSNDMKYFLEINEINIGAKASDWGKYYAWNSVISVYNPLVPEATPSEPSKTTNTSN